MSATATTIQQQFKAVMTVRDVAVLLGVHVATVYRLIEAGTIKPIRGMGQLRFSGARIKQWIDGQ